MFVEGDKTLAIRASPQTRSQKLHLPLLAPFAPAAAGPPSPRTSCPVCLRPLCRIRTHWEFAYKVQPQRQSNSHFRTSFVWSYAFNPLSQAVDYTLRAVPQAADLLRSVPGLHSSSSISSTLHIIGSDIQRNTPFEDPVYSTFGDIGEEWICLASSDLVASVSTLCLWAVEIAQTYSNNIRLLDCRYELTNYLLKMLRRQLDAEDDTIISDGTIFASATHINYSNLFFEQSKEEREKLMDGLEALVDARGGLCKMVETASPRHRLGLRQTVIWADELTAWRNACFPRFSAPDPPTIPASLQTLMIAGADFHSSYKSVCTPEILAVAKYLRVFLLFRSGAALRTTSQDEYKYLVQSEVHVHYQLLQLHAQYVGTGSLIECIVLAMGIVRCEILSCWEHHVLIRADVRRRLMHALKSADIRSWLKALNRDIEPILWVCIMALTRTDHVQGEEDVYLDVILTCLKTVCTSLRDEWHQMLLDHSRPLLWHPDHDKLFEKTCDRIRDHVEAVDGKDTKGPRLEP